MKILIIGASGLIGRHLVHDLRVSFGSRASIRGTYHSHPFENGIALDITDYGGIARCLVEQAPDIVIWLAGSKNVNLLEHDASQSIALNETPVRNLVTILTGFQHQPRLIYLSSDYVFCGRTGGYLDNDVCQPNTVYGLSKVLAEDMLMGSGLNAICLRTAAVMSKHGGFLGWLLRELDTGNSVSLFENTIFSPTPPLLLSNAIRYLCLIDSPPRVLNFAGPPMSRYSFGRKISERFGYNPNLIRGAKVNFSSSTLHPDLSLVTSGALAKLAPKSIADFSNETCS